MAGKRKTLSDYEEGILADMMLGSGVFHPRPGSKGMRVGYKLERAGYLRREESVRMSLSDPVRYHFFLTPKGRNYYLGRVRVPGTVSYKREAKRHEQWGKRSGRAASERARLRAALKDA